MLPFLIWSIAQQGLWKGHLKSRDLPSYLQQDYHQQQIGFLHPPSTDAFHNFYPVSVAHAPCYILYP